MKTPPIKVNWLERAVQVHNYHVTRCKEESSHTLEKTANELNRSTGSISQDILVAQWVKTHEKQLRRFRCMKDAIHYIKSKKQENFKEIEI